MRCWQEVLTEAGGSGDVFFSVEYTVSCMAGYMGTKGKSEGLSGYTRILPP